MEELLAYLEPAQYSPADIGVDKKCSLYSRMVSLHQCRSIEPGDVVVLGVNESRNSRMPSLLNIPDIVRQYLFGLSAPSIKGRVVDAGNIIATDSPAQTYRALEAVMGILGAMNSPVVLLGGTQELTECVYRGFRSTKELITLSVIDSHIDMDSDTNDFHSLNFLNGIVKETGRNLFDLSIIGYQGYYVDSSMIDRLYRLNHELLRLGFVRGNHREVEPTLRNSDIVSFDMGAIRASDSPGSILSSPNGMYAEEACQLARYAGTSDRALCFGVFNYVPAKDPAGQSAILAAQLAWHFIEGVSLRRDENPKLNDSNIKKFIINSGTPGIDFIFYRNEASDNWWFEIPMPKQESTRKTLIVPCSPADYLLASKQEIPERWIRFLHKTQALVNAAE